MAWGPEGTLGLGALRLGPGVGSTAGLVLKGRWLKVAELGRQCGGCFRVVHCHRGAGGWWPW
eukprot:scaffold17997_cov101-Isochrysis_galbana.AAC.4